MLYLARKLRPRVLGIRSAGLTIRRRAPCSFSPSSLGVIDQEVFVGRPCKALFGNPFQESFFVQCSRVERDNVISAKRCYGIIEFVAFGHPTHTVSCIIQKNLSGFQLRELTVCTRAFGSMVVPITGQQVFSTRRDRNGDNTVAVHCIIQ